MILQPYRNLIRFPFKKNLYEYAFEFVIQYMGIYYLFYAIACMMNFLLTTTIMTIAYIKDLRTELVDLNAMENSMEIREKIFAFIRLHMHAKELSEPNIFN